MTMSHALGHFRLGSAVIVFGAFALFFFALSALWYSANLLIEPSGSSDALALSALALTWGQTVGVIALVAVIVSNLTQSELATWICSLGLFAGVIVWKGLHLVALYVAGCCR